MSEQPSEACPKCGAPNPASLVWCLQCGANLQLSNAAWRALEEMEAKRKVPDTTQESYVNRVSDADGVDSQPGHRTTETSRHPLMNRYEDAYRLAKTLVAVGNNIKVIGGIIAGLFVVASLLSGSGPLMLIGFAVSAVIGVLSWVGGVVVAAQGQILQANLDSAVSLSPFLTDTERAAAMSLHASVVSRLVGT